MRLSPGIKKPNMRKSGVLEINSHTATSDVFGIRQHKLEEGRAVKAHDLTVEQKDITLPRG